MNSFERKANAVAEHVDAAIASLQRALDEPDRAIRVAKLRSAVYHWFGVMFDEGSGYRADMLSSLSVLSEQVVRLKKKNKELLKLLSESRKV